MLSLASLRQRHPVFHFDQVQILPTATELRIELSYRLENGPTFVTRYTLPPVPADRWAQLDQSLLRAWVTQLGMVEGLSYWKTACSPQWHVHLPDVRPEHLLFWLQVLQKGMSEFFFIHQLDGWQPDFVQFELTKVTASQPPTVEHSTHSARVLLPIGGGKDSIVTAELLRQTAQPVSTFAINAAPAQQRVVDTYWRAATNAPHLQIHRQLDPQLFALNRQGYLNGHTPFSAMAAFVSTLAAYLYDYRWVAVSNEWSANEGNTIFLGQSINHQYSKTVEFEQLFRQFQAKYFSTTIEYFSYLRPLHELQIAKLFTQLPTYWPVFLSCNRGQQRGSWCGECPKCLFVATILAAFLDHQQLQHIFGQPILEDISLLNTFDQLMGFVEVKSLECVGTRAEMRVAVGLAAAHLRPVPALIDYGWQRLSAEGVTPLNNQQQAAALLGRFIDQHYIPAALAAPVQRAVKELDAAID